MRAAPWKNLVRELSREGYESPYLERLRRKIDIELTVDELEREIVREMATALGRAGEKVDWALLRLDVLDREVARSNEPVERRRLIEQWNRMREEAIRARHELRIHREAVGMRRNRELEILYPIPPRRHFRHDPG